MKRRLLVGTCVVLVASSCAGSGSGRTSEQALTDFVAATNQGDITGALDLVAVDAVWSEGDFEVELNRPIADDAAWLTDVLGLGENATYRDAVRASLEVRTRLDTHRLVSGCRVYDQAVTCSYQTRDAATPISGVTEIGTVSIETADDRIIRYKQDTEPSGEPEPAWRAFQRWARIEDPAFDTQPLRAADADSLVKLLAQWEALGRPDVGLPPISDDPLTVVDAILAAQSSGDWEAWVSLLDGQALDARLGSWEWFQIGLTLERQITPGHCQITLESDNLGTVVGCQVNIRDIIFHSAALDGTNWNDATFRVQEGRVTRLPESFPSSTVAEREIEGWFRVWHDADYRDACPGGIRGPLGIGTVECASLLVNYSTEWSPLVAAAFRSR